MSTSRSTSRQVKQPHESIVKWAEKIRKLADFVQKKKTRAAHTRCMLCTVDNTQYNESQIALIVWMHIPHTHIRCNKYTYARRGVLPNEQKKLRDSSIYLFNSHTRVKFTRYAKYSVTNTQSRARHLHSARSILCIVNGKRLLWAGKWWVKNRRHHHHHTLNKWLAEWVRTKDAGMPRTHAHTFRWIHSQFHNRIHFDRHPHHHHPEPLTIPN